MDSIIGATAAISNALLACTNHKLQQSLYYPNAKHLKCQLSKHKLYCKQNCYFELYIRNIFILIHYITL